MLEAFASFGFCKAHAAAFALPTYQSAWLKAHHPAAFLAGVLTHDPGMYPKRLILDDARQFGIAVLPLDVNASDDVYRVEKVGVHDEPPPEVLGRRPGQLRSRPPDGRAYGIRLSLADVKGISDAEVARIVAARPFHSLTDLWQRARLSRPVAERLVLAGGLDALYGIGSPVPVRRRGTVTRRDLLLQVAELDRWSRATDRAVGPRRRARPGSRRARARARLRRSHDPRLLAAAQSQGHRAGRAGDRRPAHPRPRRRPGADRGVRAAGDVRRRAGARRARDPRARRQPPRRRLLRRRCSTRSASPGRATCCRQRSRAELLVAGVKVATQTPPIRSGRRVIFLTLDDGTGPVDATFFEDVQGPYAATVFHSWLLVVRGELRRTGPRGVSLRATGCWELPSCTPSGSATGAGPVLRSRPRHRPTVRRRPPRAGACWCTPAGSSSRRTPTSDRPATTPRRRRASCGIAARERGMTAAEHVTRVGPQPFGSIDRPPRSTDGGASTQRHPHRGGLGCR